MALPSLVALTNNEIIIYELECGDMLSLSQVQRVQRVQRALLRDWRSYSRYTGASQGPTVVSLVLIGVWAAARNMSEFSVFNSNIEFLQFETCLNSICRNSVRCQNSVI